MKTTIELPDDLLVAAKRRAAEDRSTLRSLIERGLRAQLTRSSRRAAPRAVKLRRVVVKGGLPPGIDLTDRVAMHDWLRLPDDRD